MAPIGLCDAEKSMAVAEVGPADGDDMLVKLSGHPPIVTAQKSSG